MKQTTIYTNQYISQHIQITIITALIDIIATVHGIHIQQILIDTLAIALGTTEIPIITIFKIAIIAIIPGMLIHIMRLDIAAMVHGSAEATITM